MKFNRQKFLKIRICCAALGLQMEARFQPDQPIATFTFGTAPVDVLSISFLVIMEVSMKLSFTQKSPLVC